MARVLEIHSLSGINLIDINSSKLRVANNKLNLLVLDDIYRQICLRNLQGIILLDLLKNMSPSEQSRITDYLTKLFKCDITHTKVLGFTRAGLCEFVRIRF